MKTIITASLKAFLILLLLSCVNTSYSRFDEKAIDDELVDIILGQFPHHGKAFYENELKIKEPKLKKTPNDFELRNDVAVAYLKLARWDEAQEHFDLNEKHHPNQYKTHANLGVMYKKMGLFSKAAFHIKKSLEIKPEGHMGLGDYYLKMIKWKQNYQEGQKTNFLGAPYENRKETAKLANKQYVITLIINDYKFVDAYLVLGDILFEEKEYQLALRAYMRAEMLGYEEKDKYDELSQLGRQRFRETSRVLLKNKSSFQVGSWLKGLRQVRNELKSAEEWLNNFKDTETEMLSNNELVTFDKIRDKMKSKGLEKPVIIEAVVFTGFAVDPILLLVFVIVLPLILYYIYDKRKRMRLAKEGKATNKTKLQSFRLSR